MGCDVHAYLEYSSWDNREGEPYWDCLVANGGSRNYALFGLLAGVRGSLNPVVEPRGLPEGKYSWAVAEAEFITISDDPRLLDDEGYCSRETALSWAEHGSEISEDGKKVSHPDHHSHTWLTKDELAEALGRYITEVRESYGVEWTAMLAAMQAIEDTGNKTRLVLWFDN